MKHEVSISRMKNELIGSWIFPHTHHYNYYTKLVSNWCALCTLSVKKLWLVSNFHPTLAMICTENWFSFTGNCLPLVSRSYKKFEIFHDHMNSLFEPTIYNLFFIQKVERPVLVQKMKFCDNEFFILHRATMNTGNKFHPHFSYGHSVSRSSDEFENIHDHIPSINCLNSVIPCAE